MTLIRVIEIANFRSIKRLTWLPDAGINCLVGPGDGGKSTVLDAIDLCLGARRSAAFTDADFHGLDLRGPIEISITFGALDAPLKNIDAYGDFLVGFNASSGVVEPEPGVGLEAALTLKLTVRDDLEPEWTLVSPRAQALGKTRNLSWADRTRIAPGRLGASGDNHLSWRRGSVVTRLTESTEETQQELMRAARDLRQGFDTSTLKELDAPLKLVLSEAISLGLPVGKAVKALLDSGAVTFSAGTISLHDEAGIPLRSLGVGSTRLLVAALQRKAAGTANIFLVDELEYGLEPHRIIKLLTTLGAKEQQPPLQIFATSHSPVVVTELSDRQLFVVRSAATEHSVTRAADAGDVQGAIRSNPHAMLARKIIVCEGASEIGIVRGVDGYFSHGGTPALATLGVTTVNGGGDETFKRANAFRTLGYAVAVLRDSDKPAPVGPETEFTSGGGSIFAWSAGRALEQELFAAVPLATVSSLLNLAIEIKERAAVAAHIANVSAATTTLPGIEHELTHSILSAGSRAVLGDAAAKYSWFKNQSTMELIGFNYLSPVYRQCAPSLTSVVDGLWSWAQA